MKAAERSVRTPSASGPQGPSSSESSSTPDESMAPAPVEMPQIEIPQLQMMWAGCEAAVRLGFDEARYNGYLQRDGDIIVIGGLVVRHPGSGAFGALVKSIHAMGFSVAIPTSSPELLQKVARKKGFERDTVSFKGELVDVWIRRAPPAGRDR